MSASRFNGLFEPLKPGDRLSKAINVERLNALTILLQEVAMGQHLRCGKNMRMSTGSNGVVMRSVGQSKARAAAAVDHPWRYRAGDGVKFTLTTGTVNSIVPTNMTQEFTALDGGRYVWLKAKLNNSGQIDTGATEYLKLESGSSPPQVDPGYFSLSETPGEAFYPLLWVRSDEGSVVEVHQVRSTNLSLTRSPAAVTCDVVTYRLTWV